MKKIYTTDNLTFLYLVQAKLEEQNIFNIIKNETPPLGGEIPAIVAPPELWIMKDEQYQQAMSILNEELLKISERKVSWQCPKCGESLEGQFDVCWKCGTSRVE